MAMRLYNTHFNIVLEDGTIQSCYGCAEEIQGRICMVAKDGPYFMVVDALTGVIITKAKRRRDAMHRAAVVLANPDIQNIIMTAVSKCLLAGHRYPINEVYNKAMRGK